MNFPRHFICLWLLLVSAQCITVYKVPIQLSKSTIHALALPSDTQQIGVQFYDGLLQLSPGPTLSCEVTVEVLADNQEQLERLSQTAVPVVTVDQQGAMQLRLDLPTGAKLNAVRSYWRICAPRHLGIKVKTQKGGVAVQGAPCDLEVIGGSGILDARLAGGSAVLETTSGSILLRGTYDTADLSADIGRIDLILPPKLNALTDLRLTSERGGIYIDMPSEQTLNMELQGLPKQMECDPDIRITWDQALETDGIEIHVGRLGNLAKQPQGRLQIKTRDQVQIRLASTPLVARR